VSFRVIAATNRDLLKEVEKGTFRRDLYYRLNVVTVRLAPLRDRMDDLPVLLDHFMRTYAPMYAISNDLREMLMNYDWPGNVRELENCVQHMVALNSGPLLHPADAPSNLINATIERSAAAGSPSLAALSRAAESGRSSESTGSSLAPSSRIPQLAGSVVIPISEMERSAIINALQYTKGDRMMAAHLLGIGRTTLYRKLKEYNIEA
jgi:DNA-binding NtrC family response regulator